MPGRLSSSRPPGASNCWLTDDNNSLIFTPYAPAAVRPAGKIVCAPPPACAGGYPPVLRRRAPPAAPLRPAAARPGPGPRDRRWPNGRTSPAPWVDATLSGRQQVALGLDGTGADQYLPVRRAGHRGERRRRRDQFRAGLAQGGIELRKTQVVADRQAEAADRRIRHHDLLTESIVVGFTIAAPRIGYVHIEQVQLVVAGDPLSVLVDQQRTGIRLRLGLPIRRQRQRSGDYPQPEVASGGIQPRQDRPVPRASARPSSARSRRPMAAKFSGSTASRARPRRPVPAGDGRRPGWPSRRPG